MKVWVACVVVFFGMAELYQWFQQVTLPFPVYGVAGLLLAMLSNRNQWPQFRSQLTSNQSVQLPTEHLDTPEMTNPVITAVSPAPAVYPKYSPGPQLPNLNQPIPSSISFTVRSSK